MDNYLVGSSEKYQGEAQMIRNESIPERLDRQEQQLRSQIDKIQTLRTLLEKNPDFEALLSLTREIL